MKKTLLLATGYPWPWDYWSSPKEAPYSKMDYMQLVDWDELERNCPLAGLGVYLKRRDNDYSHIPFVYLKIIGMRADVSSKVPYFSFVPVAGSSVESKKLTDRLPAENRKLFSAIDSDRLLGILQTIDESPPSEWVEMVGVKEKSFHWEDYIGKYFLEIKGGVLSNDEFEDRVAALLNTLGFGVDQKGHRVIGEYPDGVVSLDGYAVVYDCKNTQGFYPSAADERALGKYLSDEKKIRCERNIYSAFIADGFRGVSKKNVFCLPTESLLYLLYKKLSFGSRFTLFPFKKILDDFLPLDVNTIDKEWLR